MKEVPVYDIEGNEKGTAQLEDYFFGCGVNVPVMHLVVRRQLASARSGTAATKERAMVRGEGASPGGRRAPAEPGRVPPAPLSGGGAAQCTDPGRGISGSR
jgi:large subunit ribosomal protein L4